MLERRQLQNITNAFKINEDVVIPLPNLGKYANEIEKINIEQSILNKLKLIEGLEALFNYSLPKDLETNFDDEVFEKKKTAALKHLNFTKNKWQSYLNGFEKTSNDFQELSKRFKDELILNLIRSHKLRISWKQELKKTA